MAKIRILYIVASAHTGGAENFVHMFLKYLNNDRFEKYVVCPAGGYYTEKFKSLTNKALFINPKRSFMNLATILRVARFIKNNDINIIHTMLYTSDFCGIVARLIAGRSRILNTINGFNFFVLENSDLRLRRRIASFIYRLIYRYSDKLVAVSEAVKKDLTGRRGIKVNPQKIQTVLAAGTETSYRNFSEEDIRDLRAKYVADKGMVLTAIGSLEEVKDYDCMIEAFALASQKNKAIKLLIAGDGPDKKRLRKKVSALELDGKISFLGTLEEGKRNALLYLADIFIMSSRKEGCPTALLEAMYFEKPIIATGVGGIPEIIEDGRTGLLLPPGNPARLADAILNLSKDQKSRIRLGRNAREIFEKHFTNNHMLKAYEDVYNEIL